jgi:hypothetical protein
MEQTSSALLFCCEDLMDYLLLFKDHAERDYIPKDLGDWSIVKWS